MNAAATLAAALLMDHAARRCGVDTCFGPLVAGKPMFAGVTLAALLAFLAARRRGGVAKQATAFQLIISELDKSVQTCANSLVEDKGMCCFMTFLHSCAMCKRPAMPHSASFCVAEACDCTNTNKWS
jgi:hypothetical protein